MDKNLMSEMNKEAMFSAINAKYEELKSALEGDDLMKIRELTLELHAMVHPAEISGREEKTIADYVLAYMMQGNQNEFVQREPWDSDLKYAGSKTVPICWQLFRAISKLRPVSRRENRQSSCSVIR